MVGVLDFKKEPIWTQLLFWLTINTFVVLVALLRISEESVRFWTLESGGHPTYKKNATKIINKTLDFLFLSGMFPSHIGVEWYIILL